MNDTGFRKFIEISFASNGNKKRPMMLRSIDFAKLKPVWNNLPSSIKEKIDNPANKENTENFIGAGWKHILSRAIIEYSYMLVSGKDGNWYEFTTWTGLNEADMEIIADLCKKAGWDPTKDHWN